MTRPFPYLQTLCRTALPFCALPCCVMVIGECTGREIIPAHRRDARGTFQESLYHTMVAASTTFSILSSGFYSYALESKAPFYNVTSLMSIFTVHSETG